MFYKDFTLSTDQIAQKLLGYRLVHESKEGRTSGWIVETEAYLGEFDKAAHTYNRHYTDRVAAMYMPAGHFYIYELRGHQLINFVTQKEGVGQGVLIRALEVDEGEKLMLQRRNGQTGVNLTNGPGKLTQAMAITKDKYYGSPVDGEQLYVDFSVRKIPKRISKTPRIGIPNAGEWTEKPLRFIVAGNPYVSHRRGAVDPENGWVTE